jgi:hypothetical protein
MAGDGVALEVPEDAGPDAPSRWEGLLVKEGVSTGDRRSINVGALTWRELPLPLMLMTRNPVGGHGHDGAELAGRVDWIERRGEDEVWGGGVLDMGSTAGQEMLRLLTPDEEGRTFLRGVSADLDDVTEKVLEGEELGGERANPLEALFGGRRIVEAGRIMGVTAAPFPALQEARIGLVPDEGLVASVGECESCTEDWAALVASTGPVLAGTQARVWTPYLDEAEMADTLVAAGGPARPPIAWFAKPELSVLTPWTVTAEGRCYGHVAAWGDCHLSFGVCTPPPRSNAGYRYACNKQVLTAEGTMVATTTVVIDSVHPDLALHASDTQAFYANTGSCVADVSVYEDEFGIAVAGAMRPDLVETQERAARGSDVSPDWRKINGRLEMVGLLCVNTSGFVVPALVAAASRPDAGERPGRAAALIDHSTGEVVALVAAGMVRHQRTVSVDVLEQLQNEVARLATAVAPFIEERLSARRSSALARLSNPRRQRALARFGADAHNDGDQGKARPVESGPSHV